MRQVHLGLSHLTGTHLETTLYRDTAPADRLHQYAAAFDHFEAACTAGSGWTHQNARDLETAMPPHVRISPRHPGRGEHSKWAATNQPLLDSPRAAPIHLPWQGPWTPRQERELDALLGRIWDVVPSTGRVAVEFHHASWFRPEPMRLLEEHHAGLVWSAAAGLVPYRATSDFLYVRLKGSQTRPAGEDTAAFLQRVRARGTDPRPVHVVGVRPEAYSLRALERFARGTGAAWHLGARRTEPQASLDRFEVPA